MPFATLSFMKWIRLIFVLLLLTAGSVLVWKNLKARTGKPIATRGGEIMSVMLPDNSGTYLQKDPRWGEDKLGRTTESLRSIGCAVCSVAMACADLGETMTPKELNQQLTQNGGFTGDGWLVWGALEKITSGRISVDVTSQPSHAGLDAALKRGAYPVVKFVLPHGVPHWVVIVGKEGVEYIARDPLRKNDKPVLLSSITSRIYSMRFIRRKNPTA